MIARKEFGQLQPGDRFKTASDSCWNRVVALRDGVRSGMREHDWYVFGMEKDFAVDVEIPDVTFADLEIGDWFYIKTFVHQKISAASAYAVDSRMIRERISRQEIVIPATAEFKAS